MAEEKYSMTISRNTIDKLGVKLYDKASDVVSELVSNSYDADSKLVRITIPLGKFLATRRDGLLVSNNLKIIVEDNGSGFTESEANNYYLRIGNDRRTDRGNKSLELGRPVMGRKGIGKLAVFGICKTIEVWSASGPIDQAQYPVAHFLLHYDKITEDTDEAYHPEIGSEDGSTSEKRGTRITLSNFLYKKIPDMDTFTRQLARKFGIGSPDFRIMVTDSETGDERTVSEMDLDLLEDTKINVDDRPVPFDENSLPVRGWVAYAKYPYKNEEVAGVRIYARGKLATTARDFGRKSGFTGEHTIRSYMVGEVHADWLDDKEDLIASDRQNILWSSEMGQALQKWGIKLMEELGHMSRKPLQKKTFAKFKEVSDLEKYAKKRFGDTPVYQAALDVAKKLAGGISPQNLQDKAYVDGMRDLVLSVAPHKTIVDNLRRVSDDDKNALDIMATSFGDARIAEAASLGQVAKERIRAIDSLERNIRAASPVDESVMQSLLENAPWLIDPQWTVLQTNQTLRTFRHAFEDYYKQKTGKTIRTAASKGDSNRPDFIMLPIGKNIEVVEIKKPEHNLDAKEYRRFLSYIDDLEKFLEMEEVYAETFEGVHGTLICDGLKLDGTEKSSYDGEKSKGRIQHKTWEHMLISTKKVHESFLEARDIFSAHDSDT